jgi:hypothetical protein
MAEEDPESSRSTEGGPRFQLVTRRDCHLCDVMKAQLEALRSRPNAAFELSLVDVDSDPVLVLYYGHLVPVVLHDGVRLAELRCTDEELAARLRPFLTPASTASATLTVR